MDVVTSQLISRVVARPAAHRPLGWALRQILNRGAVPFAARDIERLARRRPRTSPPAAPDPFLWRDPAVDPAAAPDGRGLLGGELVAVKDSLAVRGAPRTDGTVDTSPPADADAALVARVRAAGGRVAGVVQMTELGVCGVGTQPHQGVLDNPAAPGFHTGGSSSGTAAAVAAGLARYGVGTDALGSVRIPSAFCGLVGLKPTHEALPRDGYDSLAPSVDMPGPMARTVADCARLWHALAATPEPTDPAPASALRLGVVDELAAVPVADAVRRAVAARLGAVGAELVAVRVPAATEAPSLCALTAAFELARHPDTPPRAPSPLVRLVYGLGSAFTRLDYERAMARRHTLRVAALRALERVDALVMPTTAIPAPARTRDLAKGGIDVPLLLAVGAFTPLANATGLPSIAVPAGRDAWGRPLSVMLVGRPGEEERLFELAAALEAAA
ncbi:MAG: amidase [Deltaproteobacteria bacterium]|nr:amidase [Deltaproteobacteria bacterium]